MASKTGPMIAAILTLGALGGAAVAQAKSDKPAKVLAAPRPELSCPQTVDPVPPATDPTGVAPLVPPIVSGAIICNFSEPLATGKVIGAQEAAVLASMLDSTHATPTQATTITQAQDTVAVGAIGAYLITFRYGTMADVSIKVLVLADKGYAFSGIATTEISSALVRYLVPPPRTVGVTTQPG